MLLMHWADSKRNINSSVRTHYCHAVGHVECVTFSGCLQAVIVKLRWARRAANTDSKTTEKYADVLAQRIERVETSDGEVVGIR